MDKKMIEAAKDAERELDVLVKNLGKELGVGLDYALCVIQDEAPPPGESAALLVLSNVTPAERLQYLLHISSREVVKTDIVIGVDREGVH